MTSTPTWGENPEGEDTLLLPSYSSSFKGLRYFAFVKKSSPEGEVLPYRCRQYHPVRPRAQALFLTRLGVLQPHASRPAYETGQICQYKLVIILGIWVPIKLYFSVVFLLKTTVRAGVYSNQRVFPLLCSQGRCTGEVWIPTTELWCGDTTGILTGSA